MKLQLFAQTWNPDNVTVFEHKDGTIPDKYNELILKDVMEGSKVMQLAKYEEMDSKEKKFEYFAKGPGAYWVGEGEKIKTSKPQWLTAKMVAKKLGVIVPCSRELLHYKVSDFFDKMNFIELTPDDYCTYSENPITDEETVKQQKERLDIAPEEDETDKALKKVKLYKDLVGILIAIAGILVLIVILALTILR